MNIGIDALALAAREGGSIITYVANLVRSMGLLAPQHRFLVFLSEEALPIFSGFPPNVQPIPLIASPGSIAHRLLAEQVVLPWRLHRLGIDVAFGAVQTLPLLFAAAGRGSVVTVYDLRFLDRPQDFSRFHRTYRRLLCGASAARATSVVTISEFTKARVLHHWRLAGQVHAIHLASGLDSEPPDETQVAGVRSRYGITCDYILTTANSPHKNTEQVIEAFALLASSVRDHCMVVAFGARPSYAAALRKRAQDLQVASRVLILDYIPDDDVSALHAGASVFVSMSRYEGFGIPILDAMAMRVPVICADAGSLPEVVRHNVDGLVVDLDDAAGLARALTDLMTDAGLRERLIGGGTDTASHFTWENTARETLIVLERSCARC